MSLEDILRRPSLKEILKDRKIIAPEIYDEAREENKSSYLARLVRNIGKDKVLKIKSNYDIIPIHYSPLKQLHKGNLIKLKRYDSLDNAVKDEATPEKLFIEALKNVRYGEHYIGLEWQGISKTTLNYRIVPFSELYQAEIIFMNQNDKELITIEPYLPTKYALERGGQIIAYVPSVKKEEVDKHRMRFGHVPLTLKNDKKHNFIWFNLTSDHGNCPEQTYYALSYYRILRKDRIRTGDEKFFDAHEIAGYWQIMKDLKHKSYDLMIIDNPLFFLNKFGFELINKMKYQIAKEYKSKGELKSRPLNDKEMCVLFGEQLALEKELLEKRKTSNIGQKIYERFFHPKDLNFAIYKL